MEDSIQKLRADLEEMKAVSVALHISLASALALITHDRTDAKQKLDLLENDLLTRTITDLTREDLPPTLGPRIRQEVSRLFRRARKNIGLSS